MTATAPDSFISRSEVWNSKNAGVETHSDAFSRFM
jgi:hypothetical protein